MSNKIKYIVVFSLWYLINLQAQSLEGNIQVDGVSRTFRYFLPKDYLILPMPPLVINYHGTGINALFQETYSGYNAIADTAGFIVCYPNANGIAFDLVSDQDVRFTEELINYFTQNHGVDLCRIYGTGFSNGGFFVQLLSCKLAKKFAAIASISGTMTKALATSCADTDGMPMLHIHGTSDGIVNYNGGSSPFLSYIGVEELMEFWKLRNKCADNIVSTPLNDIAQNDGTTSELYQNTSCLNKTALLKVTNGGHTWPGSSVNIGVTSQDFNASAMTWLFFKNKVLSPQCTFSKTVEVGSAPIIEYQQGVLSIATTEDYCLSIIDVQGRVIYKYVSNETENIRHSFGGIQGLFIVRVVTKSKVFTKKIVVK